jgi:hypothetical protein
MIIPRLLTFAAIADSIALILQSGAACAVAPMFNASASGARDMERAPIILAQYEGIPNGRPGWPAVPPGRAAPSGARPGPRHGVAAGTADGISPIGEQMLGPAPIGIMAIPTIMVALRACAPRGIAGNNNRPRTTRLRNRWDDRAAEGPSSFRHLWGRSCARAEECRFAFAERVQAVMKIRRLMACAVIAGSFAIIAYVGAASAMVPTPAQSASSSSSSSLLAVTAVQFRGPGGGWHGGPGFRGGPGWRGGWYGRPGWGGPGWRGGGRGYGWGWRRPYWGWGAWPYYYPGPYGGYAAPECPPGGCGQPAPAPEYGPLK